jgi:hypothetical protein
VGFGGEVGAVRFDEEGTGWDLVDACVEIPGIFKGNDSREGDGMSQFKEFAYLILSA